MENQFQNIDDYFRRQASGMKSPLTPEEKNAIWAGIAQAQNKRLAPIWWFLGGLGVVILLTGFYMYRNSDQMDETIKPAQTIQGPVAESQTKNDVLQGQASPSESALSKSSQYALTDEDNRAENITTISNTTNDQERPINSLVTEYPFSTKDAVAVSSKSSSITEEGFLENENTSARFDSDRRLLPDENISLVDINSTALTSEEVKLLGGKISPLVFSDIPLYNNTNTTPLYLIDGMLITCRCRTRWSVDAYSSVSRPFASIEGRSTQASELAAQWENSFDPQWLYSAGFMANFHKGRNWSVGVGAEVQRLTSYTTYREQKRSIKMNWNDQAYFFLDENGEKVWVGDSVLTTVNSTSGIRKGNTHDRIVIPVQLAYQIPLNKWTLRGGLGIAMSVWQHNQSTVYNQYGMFEKAADEWNTGIAFDGRFSFGVAYAIRNDWELFLQSSMQLGLTDWLDNEFPVSMNMNFAGLSVGTKKYL